MPPRTLAASILVSEARARFSELVERVTAHPGCSVVIGHRNRARAAVLVDAGHYEVLVAKAAAADRQAGRTFRLAGSIPYEEGKDPVAWIEAERGRQADLVAEKRAKL